MDTHRAADLSVGPGRRPFVRGAAALGLALAASVGHAPELAAQSFADHARPHEAVAITPNRSLNLFCMGEGDRTVLFDAGGSDWSVVWAPVQTAAAMKARACVYDRAGLGYSDPADGARTPFAIAQDLKRLIDTAGLSTPLIFVGHSLGGFNVKLFAALYPDDVAGLVLLDPAEERWWDRTREWAVEAYGAELATRSELQDETFVQSLVSRYEGCASAAEEGDLDPASARYRRCTDPVRPALGPEVAAARQALQIKAAYQRAQASEIRGSVYADHGMDAAYANLFAPGRLGARPVVVLTHLDGPATQPLDLLAAEQTRRLHEETAQLSTRGVHRETPGSGHYIQLDQPGAVLDAIDEVVKATTP